MSSEVSALGDPLRFGVGARLTLAVMADQYVDIILTALKSTDTSGLIIETTDVSTYLGGSEADILRYLIDLSSTIASAGHHASLTLHLFRGCPGAVVCDSRGAAPGPRAIEPPQGRLVGRYAAAEWALYPLVDAVTANGNGPDSEPNHMRDIYAAIDVAVKNGTFRKSERSVTRLEGDLGLVMETVIAGWCLVGRSVQHVASHVTVSLNSPSHRGRAT